MKKYDIDKMLKEWGGSSVASQDPYDSSESQPQDVEDLTSDGGEAGAGVDLTTNQPGPSNPQNRPGADRTKVMKEAPGDVVPTTSEPKPKPKKPPMMTPDMQPPTGMGGMSPDGMEDPMMGMMTPPGPTDLFEVGRVYELKKIYSRLVSMQSYLSGSTDINLVKLRNYVSNTMDLFRTLMSNVALYKEKLDEIIVILYKVVDNVYVVLSKYYKDKDSGKMVQALETKSYKE